MSLDEQEELSHRVFFQLWSSLVAFERKRFDHITDGLATFFMSFCETHNMSSQDFDHLLKNLSLSYKRILSKQREDEKQS